MARKIVPIDEELLLEASARKTPGGSVLDLTPEQIEQNRSSVQPLEAQALAAEAPRTAKPAKNYARSRATAATEYEKTFLAPTAVVNRVAVYISNQTRETLFNVVYRMGGGRISVSRFVENVLRDHLEQYREEINRILRQNAKTPY